MRDVATLSVLGRGRRALLVDGPDDPVAAVALALIVGAAGHLGVVPARLAGFGLHARLLRSAGLVAELDVARRARSALHDRGRTVGLTEVAAAAGTRRATATDAAVARRTGSAAG